MRQGYKDEEDVEGKGFHYQTLLFVPVAKGGFTSSFDVHNIFSPKNTIIYIVGRRICLSY